MTRDAIEIIAIDDDESNLRLVEAVLGSGYAVTTFDRPRAALQALRSAPPPDLIVCDVTMPGLDGFELHEELRKIAALRSVPFLFVTALSDRAHVRRGMTQGADDYITKPFRPGELRDAIHARLARARALREAESGRLIVTTLGGVEIAWGARRLHWEAKRVVELLLLLLDEGGRVGVERARSELWWSVGSDNHLHVLVSRLRKTLEGVGTVEIDGDALRLRLDVEPTWDAPAFAAAWAACADGGSAADVERAITAYTGTFLPGFESPWSERKRVEMEDRYAELLERAVELAPTPAQEKSARSRLERFLGVADDVEADRAD